MRVRSGITVLTTPQQPANTRMSWLPFTRTHPIVQHKEAFADYLNTIPMWNLLVFKRAVHGRTPLQVKGIDFELLKKEYFVQNKDVRYVFIFCIYISKFIFPKQTVSYR